MTTTTTPRPITLTARSFGMFIAYLFGADEMRAAHQRCRDYEAAGKGEADSFTVKGHPAKLIDDVTDLIVAERGQIGWSSVKVSAAERDAFRAWRRAEGERNRREFEAKYGVPIHPIRF